MCKKKFANNICRIYVYPFVCSNIVVVLLAVAFQLLTRRPVVFSLCSSATYIAMFSLMIRKYKTIVGRKPPIRTLIFLIVLMLLLSLSVVSRVVLSLK